ncbi:glycosyltransferase [Mediterraneibacter catenae]|uniref:Glycosyltransferase n=1 Tax=Mediterraneibacter catenae TaxID=2594882 RepID=A0A5M9HVM8_9FIRM|nr:MULTISPECIES: glycosyltransferase [Mediterraneibacter]KAA8501040.1 glycosyltransferase [Mediterraneibacter catenae]MDN0044758.1 glycosyltransferase [Mediterraneibacter glycyrrhizinilyticus]
MPKVSIVIPTYNVENYLRECMESVINQTLSDIEIICINDGSTDGSLKILREYADRDERVILIDKKNEGYGVGMNTGMDIASGEYIGIVEPDDFVPLTMYEDLYNIAKDNELDFVKADFYRFTRDSRTGELNLVYNRLDPSGENYNQVISPFEKPYVTKFIMNTWSGIYRRQFIEEHHIRHNTTPGAAFQDNGFFWQTFMYAKRCMFLDRPYYMNRRDNPNSSVKNKEKVYCMNIEYDFIRDIFMQKENEKLWDRFKYYFNYKRYFSYLFTLGRISKEFKRGYVERISREFKRARSQDELDFKVFTPNTRKKISLLIQKPTVYYWKYVVLAESPAGKIMRRIKKRL